jgi:ATP synthase subunit 6
MLYSPFEQFRDKVLNYFNGLEVAGNRFVLVYGDLYIIQTVLATLSTFVRTGVAFGLQVAPFIILLVCVLQVLDFFFSYQLSMVRRRIQSNYFSYAIRRFYRFMYETTLDYLGRNGEVQFPFFFFLFVFIAFLNVIGLIPYSFSLTSQLVVTISMSFIIWYGIIVLGLERMGAHFFACFVPIGLPRALSPALMLIELVSYVFRMFSLALRLFANVVAGHILFELLGMFIYKAIFMSNGFTIFTVFIVLISSVFISVLVLFELFVCVLQAYIFTILSLIYTRDVYFIDFLE